MSDHIFITKKIRRFKKKIKVSSDKSISIRSVLLASQAVGTSKISNLLESEDVLNTLKTIGMELAEDVGPTIESLAKGLASLAGFLKENNLVFPGFLLYLSYFFSSHVLVVIKILLNLLHYHILKLKIEYSENQQYY